MSHSVLALPKLVCGENETDLNKNEATFSAAHPLHQNVDFEFQSGLLKIESSVAKGSHIRNVAGRPAISTENLVST